MEIQEYTFSTGGPPMIIMKLRMMVNQRVMSDNNDQVPGDPEGGPLAQRGPGDGCRPKGPQGSMGPVAPVFMNLHIKCPIFSTKDEEDSESHLLHSNDWMNSQGLEKMQNMVSFDIGW